MQWIKTHSARRWNGIHGSKDHLWGDRFFARVIKTRQEYEWVMRYIDHNPVKAGLAPEPVAWKASGAYFIAHNIDGLVDFIQNDRQHYVKLLPPLPLSVERIMPPVQLKHILQYRGIYNDNISRLYALIPTIPKIGDKVITEPPVYLHYFTGTADYFIFQYDGEDTMFGKVRFSVYPAETKYQKFSLSNLKSNQFLELDLGWCLDNRKGD